MGAVSPGSTMPWLIVRRGVSHEEIPSLSSYFLDFHFLHRISKLVGSFILWMGEILHHLRSPGNDDSPVKYQQTMVPHCFLGAKWILSIHSMGPRLSSSHRPVSPLPLRWLLTSMAARASQEQRAIFPVVIAAAIRQAAKAKKPCLSLNPLF